jgi:hypothetical protein
MMTRSLSSVSDLIVNTDTESISEPPFLPKAFDRSPSPILTDGNGSLVAVTSETRISSDGPIDRRSEVRSSYKRPAAPCINRSTNAGMQIGALCAIIVLSCCVMHLSWLSRTSARSPSAESLSPKKLHCHPTLTNTDCRLISRPSCFPNLNKCIVTLHVKGCRPHTFSSFQNTSLQSL